MIDFRLSSYVGLEIFRRDHVIIVETEVSQAGISNIELFLLQSNKELPKLRTEQLQECDRYWLFMTHYKIRDLD